MKKNKLLASVLSLFLLVPASITCAQTVSSQKGLTTAIFNLQQGVIRVYLPDDIRPGDNISGRIVAEPVGKNAKQTRSNLAQLNNYSINIYNSKISVDSVNKPFHISIPPGKPKSFRVGLTNAAGAITTELTVPSIPEKELQMSSDFNIPSHALTGSPLRITGPFDGDASNTQCMLDKKPMEILAESPRVCIVSFPSTAGGMHSLNNQENAKPASAKMISGVDMTVSAGKLNLLKGEKTYIDVQITGLQNLPDTARLTLINTTPDVITLANGNTNTVSIPPKPDSTMSTYSQRFTVQSIKTGTFTANVDFDLPDIPPATTPSSVKPKTSSATKSEPILIFGEDMSIDENGQHIYSNENELYKIYAHDDSIRIFFKKTFLNEFVVTNPGSVSVQKKLAEYADDTYAAPAIGCDSLTRICRKNAALNVFWGDVYSVFEGKAESRYVKGETLSKSMNSSLLITRGWEINCCMGQYQLKLFFEAMQEGSEKKESHLTFSKIIRNGKPCIPITCPECKATCDETKRLMEEGRKQMEEIRKKNAGKN